MGHHLVIEAEQADDVDDPRAEGQQAGGTERPSRKPGNHEGFIARTAPASRRDHPPEPCPGDARPRSLPQGRLLPVDRSHLAERCAAFVIIVIGEQIVDTITLASEAGKFDTQPEPKEPLVTVQAF